MPNCSQVLLSGDQYENHPVKISLQAPHRMFISAVPMIEEIEVNYITSTRDTDKLYGTAGQSNVEGQKLH